MELWEEDLYEILVVDDDATPEEVRKAYKKLAIELHPDRFPDDDARRDEATVQFGRITNAYNILKDEEERAEYDFARKLGFAGSNGPPKKSPKAGATGEGGATGSAPAEADDGVGEARRNQAANQFDQGRVFHKSKNWAKAIQHYKEAARLNPMVADYHAYLGLAYTQQGLKTAANKSFENAFKIDKKHSILKEHYGPAGKKEVAKKSGFFGSLMALFGGGKKDEKGKKGAAKGKDAKKKVPPGKKAAGKR